MSRTRRIAIVFLFLLACLGVVTSTAAVWAHQVALNTDRWVSIIGPLASDPEVVASVSDRLATQVVTALDVESRVSNVLPAGAGFLSATLATGLHDVLAKQIARRLESEKFQSIWITANRFVHQQVVRILRGDLGNVTITRGVVELNLLGLIDTVLRQLQTAGLIPASVVLPDIANVEVPAQAIARLESALGVDLPDDFGQIPLVKSDRLATAQAAVRIFDLVVVGLIVLTIVLGVAVVALARSRRRAILALALGGAVSLVIARLVIRGVEGALVDALAEGGGAPTVRVAIRAVMEDAVSLVGIVAVVALLMGVVAYLAGRPGWVVSAGTAVKGSTGQVASTASSAAVGATSAGRTGLPAWIGAHRTGLRWFGAGAIVFFIGLVAVGPELAILAAAVLGLYWIGVEVLGARAGDEEISAG